MENVEKREEVSNLAKKISMKKPFIYCQPSANKKGRRRVIVGIVSGNSLRLGISTCGKNDQFEFETGFKIALNRSKEDPSISVKLSENQNAKKVFNRHCSLVNIHDLGLI